MKKETIAKFGEMATLLRYLVGGRDHNGIYLSPASVEHASNIVKRLRVLLDEYDNAIIEEATK